MKKTIRKDLFSPPSYGGNQSLIKGLYDNNNYIFFLKKLIFSAFYSYILYLMLAHQDGDIGSKDLYIEAVNQSSYAFFKRKPKSQGITFPSKTILRRHNFQIGLKWCLLLGVRCILSFPDGNSDYSFVQYNPTALLPLK